MISRAAARPAVRLDIAGVEWVIDAFGCRPEACTSVAALTALLDQLVVDLDLHPAAPPVWRTFDGGGITGLLLLTESHFTCHSFPESGFVAFNLYCCRRRPGWAWEEELGRRFGAVRVVVRELVRG